MITNLIFRFAAPFRFPPFSEPVRGCYIQSFAFKKASLIQNERKMCSDCHQSLRVSNFHKKGDGFQQYCKECMRLRQYKRRCTPKGWFAVSSDSIKQRMTQKVKNKQQATTDCDITPQYIESVYNQQNGKCIYSHIAVSLRPHCDF